MACFSGHERWDVRAADRADEPEAAWIGERIGQIYDAALNPDRWPAVLGHLASSAHCEAALLTVHESPIRFSDQPAMPNATAVWMSAAEPSAFDPAAAERRVFQLPLFSGSSTAAALTVWHGPADADLDRVRVALGPLLPHFRRAAEIMLLANDLQRRRDSARAALERVPTAVVLLNDARCVMFANAAARRQWPECEHPATWPIDSEAVVIERVGATAHDGAVPGVIVVIAGSGPNREVEESSLCELFHLTPTEARVAAALAGGLTVAQAARSLGIRVTTCRWHLRHILAKTETARQPQLISVLLNGIASINRS